MKTKLVTILALLCFVCVSFADAPEGWTENYAKALEQAKTEHKQVLLDFTGSDWCGWCKKLDAEVFSTAKFKEYADKHLVLVQVDFPHAKQLGADVKAQNDKLAKQHKIQGYPTIVVLNSHGKKVGELGYQPGGPDPFIASLKKFPKY
jgi:thioredoxin-related protein